MDNFARTEKFILEHPEDAQALAAEWQEFAEHNPGILPTNTRLLAGKDIVEAYFYIRDQHEETQMRNEGSVDLSRVPQSMVGAPALAVMFFQRSKIMQHDDDYIEIEEKLKNEWLAKNPGKDFTSKEGLDYLHGSLDNDDAASLRKDAEKTFRDNPKYQKRIERYDREKSKIYKNADSDPAVERLKTEIEKHIEARGGDPEDIIQRRSWERFTQENPDKAKAYAQINADIKKAHEKQEIKKQLAEVEQKTGKQIRYVEKIHRPQGMSPEEAARRLESIKPSQQQKEDKSPGPNVNIRQLTKQLEMQSKAETGIVRPQSPRGEFQPERFMNRGAGRGIGNFGRGTSRVGGRLAGRAGNMAGKLSGRAGKMLGKFALQIGTKLVTNPWGLLIIGIIILLFLLVFIIVMSTGKPKPVPTLEGCIDENGNTIVKNGNECAANLASFYSKEEGNPDLTARCVDKCTNFVDKTCNRNTSNTCDPPATSCGTGAHLQVFCIEYDPPSVDGSLRQHDCLTGGDGYIGTPLGVNSCGGDDETPTPIVGCGSYVPSDPTNCGGLSCNQGGGCECNHCACRWKDSKGNSCEDAGYACFNSYLNGKQCFTLYIGGIVFKDNDRDGIKDAGEPKYADNLVEVCTGVDRDGDPICHTEGDAVIAVTKDGSDKTDENGTYRISGLQKGEHVVTLTPPSGYIGTGVTIRSFKKSCPNPSSLSCDTNPEVEFTNSFNQKLSNNSARINIPPSPNLPTDSSRTTVDFGIAPQ